MRYLWNEYYEHLDRGFTPAEFQAACETVAGKSYEDFFNRYVRSRTELTIPITQTGWPLSAAIEPVENPTPEQMRVYARWLRQSSDPG